MLYVLRGKPPKGKKIVDTFVPEPIAEYQIITRDMWLHKIKSNGRYALQSTDSIGTEIAVFKREELDNLSEDFLANFEVVNYDEFKKGEC